MTLAPQTQDQARRYKLKIGDQVVAAAELRTLLVKDIERDFAYQRNTNPDWIEKHKPFDPMMAGAIVVSFRGGRFWVVDGGHRLDLARASGFDRINCYVLMGLSQQVEARLFVAWQRDRTNLSSFAMYRGDVIAQNPETLAIRAIVLECDFQLAKNGPKSGRRDITAIDAVKYVYRMDNRGELLRSTLNLIKEVWFDVENATRGPILKGIAILLEHASRERQFDRSVLKQVLLSRSPSQIELDAKEIAAERKALSATAPTVAAAILFRYNEKAPRGKELSALTINGRRVSDKPRRPR